VEDGEDLADVPGNGRADRRGQRWPRVRPLVDAPLVALDHLDRGAGTAADRSRQGHARPPRLPGTGCCRRRRSPGTRHRQCAVPSSRDRFPVSSAGRRFWGAVAQTGKQILRLAAQVVEIGVVRQRLRRSTSLTARTRTNGPERGNRRQPDITGWLRVFRRVAARTPRANPTPTEHSRRLSGQRHTMPPGHRG
jgi:hypothetical protein